MMEEALVGGLDMLPPEIWTAVCRHLDVVDVVILSEVSRATYAIAHNIAASKSNRLIGTIGNSTVHYPAYRLKRAMAAWKNIHWHYVVSPPTGGTAAYEEAMLKFWRQFKKLPGRDRIVKLELRSPVDK
eukprot:gene29599-34956_t